MKYFFGSKKDKNAKQQKLQEEIIERDKQTDYLSKFVYDELEAADHHLRPSLDVRNGKWNTLDEDIDTDDTRATSVGLNNLSLSNTKCSEKVDCSSTVMMKLPSKDDRVKESLPSSNQIESEIMFALPSSQRGKLKTVSVEWLNELKFIRKARNKAIEPTHMGFPLILKTIVQDSTLQELIQSYDTEIEGCSSLSKLELVDKLIELHKKKPETAKTRDSTISVLNLRQSETMSDKLWDDERARFRKLLVDKEEKSETERILLRKNSIPTVQLTRLISSTEEMIRPRSTAAPADNEFFSDGIHISFLDVFINNCGGLNTIKLMTVQQICEQFIKPLTLIPNKSYCEFFKKGNDSSTSSSTLTPALISFPNVYVSYSKESLFVEVVEALKRQFQAKSDVFLWIDLFCLNWHSPRIFNSDVRVNTINIAQRMITDTILVLPSSWTDKSALTSGLSLFEVYTSSFEKDHKLNIALTKEAERTFKVDLSVHFESFYKPISELKIELLLDPAYKNDNSNVRDSSFIMPLPSPEDDTVIKMFKILINKIGHSDAVNENIISHVRHALIRLVKRILLQAENETMEVHVEIGLKMALGKLYRLESDFSKALPLFQECYKVRLKRLLESDRLTLESLSCVAQTLHDEKRYDQAEVMLQQCLSLRRKYLGETDIDSLESGKHIAQHYWARKSYDLAGPHMIDWAMSTRKVLGPNHEQSLLAAKQLATLYSELRQYSKAELLYDDSLKRHKELLGVGHPDTLKLMNSIGIFYWNQRKYGEAESVYKEILSYVHDNPTSGEDLTITVNTGNQQDVLKYMNNLGLLYRDQAKYDLAEPLFVYSYNKLKSMLSEDHIDTLKAAGNLGRFYLLVGRLSDSETLFNKMYNKSMTLYGPKHPITLKSMSNLAELYLKKGEPQLGRPLLVRYLADVREELGENSAEICRGMFILAQTMYAEGDIVGAEDMHTACLKKRKDLFGLAFPDTSTSLVAITDIYLTEDRFKEAENPCKEAVYSLHVQLGVKHIETMWRLRDLSRIYITRLEFEKANHLFESIIPHDHLFNSTQTPSTLEVAEKEDDKELVLIRLCMMNDYGIVLADRKNYKGSHSLLNNCLKQFINQYSAEHGFTLTILYNIATVNILRREYDKAETQLNNCLKKQIQTLGQNHLESLQTQLELGCLLLFGRRYSEAEPHLISCYETYKEIFGDEHTLTTSAAAYLMELYRALA